MDARYYPGKARGPAQISRAGDRDPGAHVVPEDESALLERARAGDSRAFEELVAGARGRTWAVCYRITGNAHDAEDALQDALMAAWRNLGRFRGQSRFSTWLHRIASNAALAIVRKRRDVPRDEIEPGPTGAPHIEDRVADVDAVQRALARIPADFRAALVLREFADLTYDEIAHAQGIPVQTVKSRLNRARRAVAELLEVELLEADV